MNGMTLAIEPMVNIGTPDILTLEDNWTIITADRQFSAHYENTILITDDGIEILTLNSLKKSLFYLSYSCKGKIQCKFNN